eukprot:TRINITY_DN361_c0_g1_i1.p1 TRINITY_DN361_c0_g1~~TRINITY_DN361_c0_g1_i1.p1  ORF type:complete len:312 (+),score=57.52 TRINITY_DN361_c0_g1_i1:86-937(+)
MAATSSTEWAPPESIQVLYKATANNKFSSINSPTAGARTEKPLPSGNAPFQLYSLATPNGHKPAILLEELGLDYDAHIVDIMKGDQFTSGFVEINPNSKIPAALDKAGGADGKTPIRLFESASILLYLAEKYHRFLPAQPEKKVEVINWLFWQIGGQGPQTGNFGHFMVYAPDDKKEARDYGVGRYGMEVQRLCSVLDLHLKDRTYMVGEEYTIADIAIFPWVHQLRVGYIHKSGVSAKQFLEVDKYTHLNAWADRILERPAVKRGLTVCSRDGAKPWLEKKE